jgi:hypothetical protein
MAVSLREVMARISLNDLQVAPDGKVLITNPDVASRISALKGIEEAEPTNGSQCTSNGSQCGGKLE